MLLFYTQVIRRLPEQHTLKMYHVRFTYFFTLNLNAVKNPLKVTIIT